MTRECSTAPSGAWWLTIGLAMVAVLSAALFGCDREQRTESTPSPPSPEAVGEKRGDAGGSAAPMKNKGAHTKQMKLARGRLLADLPAGFEPPDPRYAPPGAPESSGFTECHRRDAREPTEIELCSSPWLIAASDLEQFSRWHVEKRWGVNLQEVHLEKLRAADEALSVIRAVPEKAVPGINSHGANSAAAFLYVGHPDGTVISLEVAFVESSRRDEALTLSKTIAASLRPGEVALTRHAGRRKFLLYHDREWVSMPLPEGFAIIVEEGIDSWSFVASTPHRVGAEPPTITVVIHNSPSPRPFAEEFPDHTGRRQVKLFGRTVQFLTDVTASRRAATFRELEGYYELFLSAHADSEQALGALLSSFEEAELHLGHNPDLEDERDGGPPSDCGYFVVDMTSPLNVRSAPGAKASVVASLDRGTKVDVVEERGLWLRLKAPEAGWAWTAGVRRQCVELPWPSDDE